MAGDPEDKTSTWIPAFAGMTRTRYSHVASMKQMIDNTIEGILGQMGKTYRSWKPRRQRVESTWNFLVQELEKKEAFVTVATASRFSFALPSFASLVHIFQIRALRPVLAVLVFALLGTGSLLQVASASLPGDALYTVKLVRERAQVRLTADPKERRKLAVQFAVTRADEMKRVVEGAESNDRKAERISLAVKGLEEQVNTATDVLVATNDKKEFAMVVGEGAEQIVSLLSAATETAQKNNGVVAKEMAKALQSISETKELVGLVVNPPTTLALSVQPTVQAAAVAQPSEAPATPQQKKISTQPVQFTNPAQSVFSLPFAMSVVSEGNLPFAVSIQSAP